MTVMELRNLFASGTEITVTAHDDSGTESVVVNNLLLGNPSFAEIPLAIRSVYAVGENKISAEIDMPVEILMAWKKYAL